MKIRAMALQTFGSLLRNKLIILFFAGFICVVLLMMTPLAAYKAVAATMSVSQAEALVLGTVSLIMSMVSGFGSLLAAWAAADVVASEMKAGTILAIMARPVRRWEFLLGKYLGVQLLMLVYVAGMVALTYLLAWIGGEKIQSAPWTLLIYPLVRYAIYSAISMLLVTMIHPVIAFATVLVIAVAASILSPSSWQTAQLPGWLKVSLYSVVPSTGALSEIRFLGLTQSDLHAMPWTDHATILAYGLDYALVCFLLAVWSFRKKSLSRA